MAFKYIDKSDKHSYPKDEKGWADLINRQHATQLNRIKPLHFQWAVNCCYYHGYQNLRFNPISQLLMRDLDESDYCIINRIAPYVEIRVAKLTRGRPILAVSPDKDSPEIIKAAELSEQLLKYLWEINHEDSLNLTHALLLTLTGSSIKKVIWNPSIGDTIEEEKKYPDGSINFDKGKVEMDKIFMGEIETHIRSPFSILASPGAKNIKSAKWIIDRIFKDQRYILDNYDIDKKYIRTNKPDMTYYESLVQRLGSPMYTGILTEPSNTDENEEERTDLIKEFWMNPDKVYPEGVFATVIGDKLVSFDEFPYEHKEKPFVMAVEKEDPFGFYGLSTITRMIPLQRNYNDVRTQLINNVQLMCNAKMMCPKGSGVTDDAFTDEAGEVVEYNPNVAEPHQMAIQPLPNYIMNAMELDKVDLRDVSGEREASQMPYPNITAGVALETAAELADIIIQPTLRRMELAEIACGEQKLMLANQFYSDPRKLKITGDNNEIIVREFKNVDLKYQTDVTVSLESQLSYSKSAQQAKLVEMWDRRIITDPEAFKRAYITGKMDMIFKSEKNEENVVLEDIDAIKNGKMPMVLPMDNHIVHIRVLSKWIQTPEFRRIPADRQQIAMQVLQAHIQAVQPQQQEQVNPAASGTPFGSQVVEGPSNQGGMA